MPEHCVVISLLPGRGESARAFMRELADGRRAEQERSERRIGIAAARWFLGSAAEGELLVGMIDSGDLARATGLLSVSMDPHDLWFKRRFAELTGVDLNETASLQVAEPLEAGAGAPDPVSGAPPMVSQLAPRAVTAPG
ncbi:MAG TPA: hypothetical protein VFM19_06250 [Candidatus Limnocylindria bacterium]|nr:hypothetical protein [Candidatus Limnocylindria bacterium]